MQRSILSVSMWVVFLGWVLVAAPVFGQEMSIKIGLNRVSSSGMEYIHDDGTTPITVSDSSVGNELFLEWLISERFGLEINSAISPWKRPYSLESGRSKASEHVLDARTSSTFGAHL